jgi:hypothetical protein
VESAKNKVIEKHDFEITRTLFCYKKIIDINILNDIKTKDCKSKNNNDKKSDNEKTTENDISDIKFANMTNLKLFKYANMFINKTFNNLL